MSSEGEPPQTFIDLVLAGRARASDIEDFVDAWHDAPEGSVVAATQLHDYLGLTWDEYRLWVERPESLRFVLAARRAGQPVEAVLRQISIAGAAARSSDPTESAKVLRWLIERGRVAAQP
jgi:hypothetical protein